MWTKQEAANQIGRSIRKAEASAKAGRLNATVANLAELHRLLSQGCVDFLPDVNWQEAAGQGGAETQATDGGGKTPPPEGR